MKYQLTQRLSILIREQRIKRNLTRQELADITDISERTIYNIEEQKNPFVRESTLKILATALRMDLEELTTLIAKPGAQSENLAFIDAAFQSPYRTRIANLSELKWIESNNKKVYEGIDQISFSKMEQWFKSYPNAFHLIIDSNGQICGNIDILPLSQRCFEKFTMGKIIEEEFTSEDIVRISDTSKIRNLYIESFVSNVNSPICIRQVLMSIPKLLRSYYPFHQVTSVIAIAASQGGKRLLEHLGFSLIEYARNRKDKHDLYSTDIRHLIENLTKISNDYEKTEFTKLLADLETNSI